MNVMYYIEQYMIISTVKTVAINLNILHNVLSTYFL